MKINIWTVIFLLTFLEVLQVFCQRKCPTLENPKHGKVRFRARGRIAKFRCWRKYTMMGPKIIICSGNKWSLDPPVCIKKGCDDITATNNLTITKEYNGAVVKFECAPPLKLTGEKMLTCDGTDWNAPVPSCEFVEPSNYCDFEDEDICYWQHDTQANFKWKRNSGPTPTRRTGPSYDHTLGKDGNGHYMYMESSSPVKKLDTSRLLSPYYPSTSGGLCFEIWYHMFGQAGFKQVGDLNLYVQEMGQTFSSSTVPDFSVSGNKGDVWLRGEFQIGKRKNSFRIVVAGTKQKSYLGDISIDDPKLYNCSDGSAELTTAEVTTEVTISKSTEEPMLETTTAGNPIITTTYSKPKTKFMITTERQDKTTYKPTTDTLTKSVSTTKQTTTSEQTETTMTTAATTDSNLQKSTIRETTMKVKLTSPVKKTTVKMVTTATEVPTTETKPTTTAPNPTTRTTETSPTTRTSPTSIETTPQITSTKIIRTPAVTTEVTTELLSTKPTPTMTTTYVRKPTTEQNIRKPTTEQTNKSTKLQTTQMRAVKTTTEKSSSAKYSTGETSLSTKSIPFTNKNITDSPGTNITTTEGSVQIVEPTGRSDHTPLKPLMIGVGVGIAIGLIIVIGAVYIYLKKRRKNDIFEDEMEPIAKNAVYD